MYCITIRSFFIHIKHLVVTLIGGSGSGLQEDGSVINFTLCYNIVAVVLFIYSS